MAKKISGPYTAFGSWAVFLIDYKFLFFPEMSLSGTPAIENLAFETDGLSGADNGGGHRFANSHRTASGMIGSRMSFHIY